MNRAERRRSTVKRRPVPDVTESHCWMGPESSGAPDHIILSNPGCDSEEHQDMIWDITLSSLGASEAGMPGPGDLVMAGSRVQWSCGCWFSIYRP